MAINGINPNAAVGAYLNSQHITGGEGDVTQNIASGNMGMGLIASDGGQSSEGPNALSFSDLLEGKIEKTVDTMQRSEDMSAKAVTGDANITDVVQAVTDAELTLQTVVAVRDKMISAYQEVMRMQI